MRRKRINEFLEKNKEDWELLADEFSHTRHNPWFEFWDLIEYVKEGDRVLDLGCGNGRLCNLLKNKKAEYVGVDQSEKLIALAKKKFQDQKSEFKIQNSKCKFVVANALDLEEKFPQNEFNVIFTIAFLHHIPSRELRLRVLRACGGILKPGGFLICAVWNLYQPKLVVKYGTWSVIFGKKDIFIPFKTKKGTISRYYHVFGKRELVRLVEKAGFKTKKCYYVQKGRKTKWLEGYNLILIGQK